MTCERITLPDGTTAIVCSRGKRRARCGWCTEEHTLLCDHPTKPGKTCSKRLCATHARQVGSLDLCPAHAPADPKADHALRVYTSTRWHRDPDAFDISRGNGGPAAIPFAPSKAILLPALAARAQAKLVSPDEARAIENAMWAIYEPAYRAEMRRSYVENRAAWDRLLARERVVLQCYCPLDARLPATELLARGHCHRVLLAQYLTACGAVYMGELAARARAA
jgi:hypothetical protein